MGNAEGYEEKGSARDSIAKKILVSSIMFSHTVFLSLTLGFNTEHCFVETVFRAKVLEKVYQGQETRFDVQIIHTYRNRYRMEHREFLWAPNKCDCPYLEVGHQYILMLRRHINYERTLNRILLEEDSYVQPYRAREDSLLRPLEELCGNRGTRT